ncbi:right-handed parallel beta-helix repeat-containing protein [Haloarchaeobius amylolyticus]|uniref:right-handed parallel beta-helix repeat-containing protein n=1 Tax=Haloarchaeobius amylolyticus TaxID=1198296 RepID=UPI00226FD203
MTEHSPSPDKKRSLTRRDYLRAASVAGISAAAFSGATTASGQTAAGTAEPTVYNVVEEGADPTGQEPIDPVLGRLEHDNAVLEFPNGRYKIQDFNMYGRENFTLRGIGDDVVLVPSEDYNRDYWLQGWHMRNFTFENFTIDNSATDCGPCISFGAHDNLLVRNVTKVGYHDTDSTAFGFYVLDEDGQGLVENLVMRDGSIPVAPVGVYTASTGKLVFRDCEIEGFGNNGLYASTGTGPIGVEGGVYKNNLRSQVRLGAPGSYVRDAEVVVDASPDKVREDWVPNYRGIRISDNPGPVTVENCEVKMLRGRGFGGIVNAFDGGSVTVRDTNIHVGADYLMYWNDDTAPAVYVDQPSDWEQSGQGGERLFENVSITGSGDAFGRNPVVLLFRGNNTFRNCCIQQTGTDRDGIETWNIDHEVTFFDEPTVVEDSTVNVPGDMANGSVDLQNCTASGTCPVPSGVDPMPDGHRAQVSLADVPIPGNSSRKTYPVMGTDDSNPTMRFYGNFVYPNTKEFVFGNLQHIIDEYVVTGRLNVEFRSVAYPTDHYLNSVPGEARLAKLAVGVWDKNNWENYWGVFEYLFANQGEFEWGTWEQDRDLLAAAGVERVEGWIPALVNEGEYDDEVLASREQAAADGLMYVPQLHLNGDLAGANWDTEKLMGWIDDRL